MKTNILIFVLSFFPAVSFFLNAQDTDELRRVLNFLETFVYSHEEDLEILKLYEGLRVADVSDGMDMAGLPNTGLVHHAIHPDWVDLEDLSHIIRGIALTVRYVPTDSMRNSLDLMISVSYRTSSVLEASRRARL